MRRMVVLFVLVSVLFTSAGCATFMHPERRYLNPERRGDVDWLPWLLNFPLGICLLGIPWIMDMASGSAWTPLPPGKIRTEWGAIIEDASYKKPQ